MTKRDCKFIKENGRWRIDAKVYFGDGTYAHCNKRWFSSKAEAKEYYDEWETKKFGEHEEDGDMPFENFYDRWEEKRLQEVRDTTFLTCDKPVVTKIFKEFFFGKTVKEAFSAKNIQRVYSFIRNGDETARMKNRKILLIAHAVEYAYMLLYINDREHQMAKVQLQKIREEKCGKKELPEREPWSDEELYLFLSQFSKGSYERIMFEFFCHAGMRLGEFLALKPKDINFQKNYIEVSHQLIYKAKGKAVDTAILKSENSYRKMVLLESDAKAIKSLIEQRGIGEDEFIFPTSRSSFRRLWDGAIAKCGIRKIVPHAVRHMLAVKLLGNCKTISDQIAIARMLGHTPSVDIDTYANHENIDKAFSLYSA